MRVRKYDLSGLDVESCDNLLVMPVPAAAIPTVLGIMEGLAWRARHVSDVSWENGKLLYENLMEVLVVNECIIDKLAQIVDALLSIGSCACSSANGQVNLIARLPDVSGYVANGDVTYQSESETLAASVPVNTDALRCEYAQSVWYYAFQFLTENVLPVATATADVLTAAIVGTAGLAGAASFVGIPVAVLAGLVSVAARWAVDGSVADFTNWLFDAKDELICAAYFGLLDGVEAACEAMRDFIDTQTDISLLDRLVAKSVFGSAWLVGWIMKDQNENGTWGTYITPGACSSCLPYENCVRLGPCLLVEWEGGDWSCGYGSGATIVGGNGWHITTGVDVPVDGGKFTIGWYPRNIGGGSTGVVTFGVRDRTTNETVEIGTSPTRPVNVLAMESGSIPPGQWGHQVSIWLKQESNGAQPAFYCASSAD